MAGMGLEGQLTLRVLAAMDFGKQLMVEYAVSNIMAGKTTDEIVAISDRLARVQFLLTSGSLYGALKALNDLQTDELITEQTKQYFILKIRKYLGV